jgi:hypothetical protein
MFGERNRAGASVAITLRVMKELVAQRVLSPLEEADLRIPLE